MEIPKVEANGLTYRYAQPSDTEAFVKWATENDKIPRKDILATLSDNNPTTTVIVVEKDGVPILFVPFYCLINIAYLGFNPEAGARDRVRALNGMQGIIANFAFDHGVREVTVQSSRNYPVGKWALKNDFKEESRSTFMMRVTPLVDPEDD